MKFSTLVDKISCMRINAALIGAVIVSCAGLVILFSSILMQMVEKDVYILGIIISIIVLSLLIIGLVAFTTVPRKPSKEIFALLKRFKSRGGFAHHLNGETADSEISAALDEIMSELHGLLQSVQAKAQSIDRDVEALTRGIHQVTADQTNLFSLSAAVESVRCSQHSGFSVISSEILSLVRRSGHLTNNVRCLADQLRAGVNEIIVELEHALRHVDPTLTNAPINVSADPVQEKTEEKTDKSAA